MIKKFGSTQLKVIDGEKVFSYDSHVATIKGKVLKINEDFIGFSQTTTRQLNLVSREYNLSQEIVNPGSKLGLKLF